MLIRLATHNDHASILDIIAPVFRDGQTYPIASDISNSDALAYWLSDEKETFVAEIDGEILGTYYLKANRSGGGNHISNCGYMTHANATSRGIASAMCEHSLSYAETAGFLGMQYNFVVSTNTGAIRLWEKFGFEIVGRLPRAFNHPTEGLVDALILFRPI